ncbi:MAG: GAF domain-containing protein, partial [Clostridia bacterium]|nr:GAF domain-containing protein [Clostridia bacterium]
MFGNGEVEWESIFQAIGNPSIILDIEHNIISANRATIKSAGVSSEKDLIGKKCYEIFHNTTEPPEGCPLQKLLVSGSFEQSEMEIEAFGGVFHVSCTPVFNDSNDKKGIKKVIHIATDITELKLSEKKLKEQQQLLIAINRGQQNFIASEDKKIAFEQLLEDIVALTDSEYGFIGEVMFTSQGNPYLKVYAISNIAWKEETRKLYEENLERDFKFHNLKNLFGYTLLTGEPVISNDPLNDPRSGGIPKGHPPLKAYLGLPIMYGDKMVAMLGIANRPGGYTEEQINLLQPLLNTIGQLVTARWVLEERNRIELELIESKNRLTKILDNINAFIYVSDMNTYEILYVNKYGREAVGDVIGRICWEVLQEGQRGICPFCTNEKLLNADGTPKGAYVWEHYNAKVNRWYECRDQAIYWIDGRLVRLEIATDITERKNIEKALRESEENYRRLFEDHAAAKLL